MCITVKALISPTYKHKKNEGEILDAVILKACCLQDALDSEVIDL